MDIQDLVQAFNRLPRSSKTPSGIIGHHWHFAIEQVSIPPKSDILHLVHPPSRFTHYEGPTQILSLPSVGEQADIVLPLLLKAFVEQMGCGPGSTRWDPSNLPFAPWSWGTENVELARALEERLRILGVREELCVIEVGNEEDRGVRKEVWNNLGLGFGPKCNQCGKSPKNEKERLGCGACRKVEYCSKGCQKKDWKTHKIACKYFTNNNSSVDGSPIRTLDFYNFIAPHMPEAQALANELGLKFPGPGKQHGLLIPIRNLVCRGKDTAQNKKILLGREDADSDIFHDVRMEVFLDPPIGSHTRGINDCYKSFEPLRPWTPREISGEEIKCLEEIRCIQDLIRERVRGGGRGIGDVDGRDMRVILERYFGGRDEEEFEEVYTLALNAMDMGGC